jgi:type VI secretion system VasD/TssJ family lipoprotein
MRIRSLVMLLVAAASATMPGCFCSKQPNPNEKWPYALCMESSPRLNWFDDRANTLFVRVFQLSSTDAFMQADAARLLGHDAMPPGLLGTPMDKTLFPSSKVTLEMKVDADAVALGVVAGYFRAQGMSKVIRKVARPDDDDDDDEEAAKKKTCMVFGPNGIEVP